MTVKRYSFGINSYGDADMVTKSDGEFVSYDDYLALQNRLNVIAVECAAAKLAIDFMKNGRTDFTLNTTATDAVIRDIKAQGAEAALHALMLSDYNAIAKALGIEVRHA